MSAAMFRRDTRGAKFVLSGLDCHLPAATADDLARRHELHGSDIVQEHRPRNGEFDIETLRQMASGIEEDSAARDVESVSGARFEYAPAADELPFQLQLQVISTILPPVAADHIHWLCRFPPHVFGIH